MVPRGVREYAASSYLGREARDLVVGAAELERASALEALRLQVHACSRSLVERARREHGRAVRDALDSGRGGEHVVGGDQRHGLVRVLMSPNPHSFPSTM